MTALNPCKVGIVTLPSRFNYGNRLQNYAVTEVYKRLGCEPESLVLGDRPNAIRLLRNVYYKLCGIASSPRPEDLMTRERIAAFQRFNARIPTREIDSLQSIDADYGLFSVGSDQVWNPGYMAYNEDFYLLEFCDASKRIALSASIGVDDVSPKSGKRIGRAAAGFRGLSVREGRAAEILREYAGCNPLVVCDPTLALSAEEWRAVASDACMPAEPYVFTYLLGAVGPEASDVLEKVTDNGRIPVVPLSDRQKPGEPNAGPAEFIGLIDHASHVVTDSFHAAVFSSILHTPLSIVHREGGASMFSRLEQLSEMLGIEEKVYGSLTYDLVKAGDYEGVDAAIGREREKFMGYLEGCLDG